MNWKPLPLSTLVDAHLPPLLISAAFTEDSYNIQLTDLTYIWGEQLDRKAIIRRSRDENTSIDPSSGDQFAIFLDKIKLGLAGGKDTTCAVWVKSETGRPSLVLSVTVQLPGGLVPLEWPVRLLTAPQATMTSQFVIPLMKAQHIRCVELEGLQGVIRDKDHVIEKLMDKLNSLGTDLGQVFPQAATKLGKKAEWNGERVKGLAGFDMESWRRGLLLKPLKTTNLIGEIFGHEIGTLRPLEEELLATDYEVGDWWEGKKGMTINLATGRSATEAGARRNSEEERLAKSSKSESTDEELFQVQGSTAEVRSLPGDITVPDDKDLGTSSQKAQNAPPHSQSSSVNKSKKKLGTVGGKQADRKAQQPAPNDESTADETTEPSKVPAKPKKTLGKIGGKKQLPPPADLKSAGEVEQEPPLEPVVDPGSIRAPTTEPASAKPKRKLGQIGGKKKKETTPVPEVKLEQPADALEPAIPRFGAAGQHQESIADSQKAVEREDGARGQSMIKIERTPTPVPRETSAERADKKREELKRELEQKAKAPVKKKRKF